MSPQIENFHQCWWLISDMSLVFGEIPQQCAVLVGVGATF